MRPMILIIFLGVVGYWITLIIQGKMPILDATIDDYLIILTSSDIYLFGRHITDLGSKPFLVPFTIVMGFVLLALFRHWLPSLIFAGGTLLTHGLNQLIKVVVQRERPRIFIEASAEGYSFPSGHAMIPIVCYGLLVYFLSQHINHKPLKWFLYILFGMLIFFIGVSRYIINVHYMTDIISGFVIGYVLLISFIYLYQLMRNYRSE